MLGGHSRLDRQVILKNGILFPNIFFMLICMESISLLGFLPGRDNVERIFRVSIAIIFCFSFKFVITCTVLKVLQKRILFYRFRFSWKKTRFKPSYFWRKIATIESLSKRTQIRPSLMISFATHVLASQNMNYRQFPGV